MNHAKFESHAFRYLACQLFAGETCVGVVRSWMVRFAPHDETPPPPGFKAVELYDVTLYCGVFLSTVQLQPIKHILHETRDFPGLKADLYWAAFDPPLLWCDAQHLGSTWEVPNVLPDHEVKLLFSHFTHTKPESN